MNFLAATEEQEKTLGLKFDYRLSTNPNAPVLYMVHGRGGNKSVMGSFRRAIPEGFNVFLPQAPIIDPEIGGFSWWLVNTTEDQTSNLEKACDLLENFMTSSQKLFGLTPNLSLTCGFSQGGALLTRLLSLDRLNCQGLALLCSFVLAKDFSQTSHMPEVLIAHGEDDDIISYAKALEGKSKLESAGAEVFFVTDKTRHKLGINGMNALKEWLLSYSS